jgi:hypothetical protein
LQKTKQIVMLENIEAQAEIPTQLTEGNAVLFL